MIGAGFLSLRAKLVAALDKKRKRVVSIDLNEPPPNMEDFVLYSDRRLKRKPFFKSAQYVPGGLLSKYNFCPKCEEYELCCVESGCWD